MFPFVASLALVTFASTCTDKTRIGSKRPSLKRVPDKAQTVENTETSPPDTTTAPPDMQPVKEETAAIPETVPEIPPPTSDPVPVPSFTPDPDTPSSLFQWVGILGNGQSLSVGAAAGTTLMTEASYNNLKLFDATGLYNSQGSHLSAVPLTEPLRPESTAGAYPQNIWGETFHGKMASTMTELSRTLTLKDLVSAHTASGYAGAAMSGIKKGGTLTSYSSGIFEASAFKNLANAQNKTFGYGAVILTHGESDWATSDYGAMMMTMYDDYNADLKAITGQSKDIPLLISQQHSFPAEQIPAPWAASTQQQWLASLDYSGKIHLIGPKYQYSYAADKVHLTAAGYEDFGKKAAEVYYRIQEMKQTWKPLSPLSVVAMDSAVIRVNFHVPVPPLKFNDLLVPPHQSVNTEWSNGKGFEAYDRSGNRVTIQSVTISGNAVDIRISGHTKDVKTIGYATYKDDTSGFSSGTTGGRFGLLTDSDAMVGQPNYSIAFQQEVTHLDSGLRSLSGRIREISVRGSQFIAIGDVWKSGGNTNILTKSSEGAEWGPYLIAASRIDIAPDGGEWYVVSGTPDLVVKLGSNFAISTLPANAFDVGVGGTSNNVWAWATTTSGQVYYLHSGSGGWQNVAGTLFEIDVGPNGMAWGLAADGRLFEWDTNTLAFVDRSIEAVSLSINSAGTVYVVNKSDRNVYHKLSGSSTWVQDTTSGGFDKVDSSEPGVVYMISGERLYAKD